MPSTRFSVRTNVLYVLVLGDQLSVSLSSLKSADPMSTVVLMCEVWEEATYVQHHKKKIAFVFSAMRHFADELRAAGWTVDYRTLDQTGGSASFLAVIAWSISSKTWVLPAGCC